MEYLIIWFVWNLILKVITKSIRTYSYVRVIEYTYKVPLYLPLVLIITVNAFQSQ